MRRVHVDVVLQRQQRGDQPAAGQLRPFLHHNLQRARRHGLVRQLHVASFSTRPTLQVSPPLSLPRLTYLPTSFLALFLQPGRDQKKKKEKKTETQERTEQKRTGSLCFLSCRGVLRPFPSFPFHAQAFSSQRREWMFKREKDDNKRRLPEPGEEREGGCGTAARSNHNALLFISNL